MGSTNLSVATKQYVDNNNTKNTAGSTNDTSLLYLIGAKTQAANPQTYSRNNTYINASGVLVNTTGFSSQSGGSSTYALLNVDSNILSYSSGSGTASFYANSPTHGSFKFGEETNGIYLQKVSGPSCAGNSYLLFPNVGTSSSPKTLATTDQIPTIPVSDVQTSDGTSIVNNTIATLPGLYAHNIEIIGSTGSRTHVFCTIITNFATSFDLPSFIAYVNNMSVAGTNPGIAATGTVTYNRVGGVEYCRTAARVGPGVAADNTITLVYHNAGDAGVINLVVGQGTGNLDLTSLTDAVVKIM